MFNWWITLTNIRDFAISFLYWFVDAVAVIVVVWIALSVWIHYKRYWAKKSRRLRLP